MTRPSERRNRKPQLGLPNEILNASVLKLVRSMQKTCNGQRNRRIAWCVILSLATSGCATNGLRVPQACPQVPDPPTSLQEPIKAEQSLQRLLFESGPSATPEIPLGGNGRSP